MSFMSCPAVSPTERSMTMTRSGTATWGAASPIPGAAYMVSTMSSSSEITEASMWSTRAEGACRTGWPYFTISRIAMERAAAGSGLAAPAGQEVLPAGAGRPQVIQHFLERIAPELLQQGVGHH